MLESQQNFCCNEVRFFLVYCLQYFTCNCFNFYKSSHALSFKRRCFNRQSFELQASKHSFAESMTQRTPASLAIATSSTTPLPESSIDPPNRDSIQYQQNGKEQAYGSLLNTYGHEFEVPDFTVKEIRDAIPAGCFQRSTLRGFGYVARDLLAIATTFYLFNTYVTPNKVPSYMLRFVLWALYGLLNGLFGTGIWVLAHECGHQAFSPHRVVNDTVGWILHSLLLVPYFSWKISHGKHHKATAHMERDMVFVPRDRSKFAAKVRGKLEDLSEITEDAPLHTLAYIVARQLLGWPMYLLTNHGGHNVHDRQGEGRGRGKSNGLFKGVNHFNPNSPIFDAKDAKLILLSDLGISATAYILYSIGCKYGIYNLLVWYLMPYLWVNNWLGKFSKPYNLL